MNNVSTSILLCIENYMLNEVNHNTLMDNFL